MTKLKSMRECRKLYSFVCLIFLQAIMLDSVLAEPNSCEAKNDSLLIEYLGTSGYVVSRGSDVILLDPYFSHQPLLRAMSLRRLRTDEFAINKYLPRRAASAVAILVGHSHYDHLLDVPYIAENIATEAKIYGSETTKNLLCSRAELRGRLESVSDRAYKPGGDRHWIEINETIRFLPIASEHVPQFPLGIEIMKGSITKIPDSLPKRARGWKGGLAVAYLIEFLDDSREVSFRIHYQDSASTTPNGIPPSNTGRVDVSILSLASHDRADGYPEELIKSLDPKVVIVGHWESFFQPYSQDPSRIKAIKFSRQSRFLDALASLGLTGEKTRLLKPGESHRICRD